MPSPESMNLLERMNRRASAEVWEGWEKARESMERLAHAPDADVVVEHVDAGGVPGAWVKGPNAGEARTIFYFHGGGYCIGSIKTHLQLTGWIAKASAAQLLSVDYRLAPEHKFPAGPDDCLAATRWAAAHAAELGADPARIMLAGDSAGGNMAAVTALRVRDEGGPALIGQMLLYPVTDYHTPGTPSYVENADGYGLTRDTMEWFWAHYLNHAGEADHPHASPLRAPDLARLPAAFIVSAEYDPLRDEAERYGERLRQAGVSVEMTRRLGMNHGFLFWVGVVSGADSAMAEACAWGRKVFQHGGS